MGNLERWRTNLRGQKIEDVDDTVSAVRAYLDTSPNWKRQDGESGPRWVCLLGNVAVVFLDELKRSTSPRTTVDRAEQVEGGA